MTVENSSEEHQVLSEPFQETSGFCPSCHSIAHFMLDRELGYYKHCPKCGYTEHINRRNLRFDKQSRQWL